MEKQMARQETMQQKLYKTLPNKTRRLSTATPAALTAPDHAFTTRKARPRPATRTPLRTMLNMTYVPTATTNQECRARIARRISQGWKNQRTQLYLIKMRRGQTLRRFCCSRAWRTSIRTGTKLPVMWVQEREKSAS